nr:B3 domain-containing protein Os12g0592300-like [Setaria viridis]
MMVAEKRCERCRKWQEHYYREHMDVTKIRFFKLMTGDFAKGISIPVKFVRNFNGQITEVVELKAASGETWHVGVDKIADELLLTSGWEDFVKVRELQENDVLLFTCSGNSSFDVLIFEASGCEKLSSLFDHKTGPYRMHKHLNDIAGRHAEQYITDSEDTVVPSQLVGSTHKASTAKKHNCKGKPRKEPQSLNSSSFHVKHEAIEEEESNDSYADSKLYYSRNANQVTEEEKEKILSLASIQPQNPAFVAVLRRNHRQRRNNFLTVPSRFAADHLHERPQEIILCRPRRKDRWFVRYYYTSYIRGFQNLQFFKFVHDNKLREEDTCVFELMKGAKRVTMTVHVIRKVGDRFDLVG